MSSRSGILEHLVLHLIVVIFLAVPVSVTFILPTSWISLTRNGDRVDLDARICLLFVIPFDAVRVEGLEKVNTQPGTILVNETEGPRMLVIKGSRGSAEIPISKSSSHQIEEQIKGFLASSDAELSLRSTAHFGISVFCGVWAGFFISIYLIYLLSWLVPHRLQWWFLNRIIRMLPGKNRFRMEIESRRNEFDCR